MSPTSGDMGAACAGAALWGFWEGEGSACDSESLLGRGLCPDEDQSCSLKGHEEPGYTRAAQETRSLTLCQDPCRDCVFVPASSVCHPVPLLPPPVK